MFCNSNTCAKEKMVCMGALTIEHVCGVCSSSSQREEENGTLGGQSRGFCPCGSHPWSLHNCSAGSAMAGKLSRDAAMCVGGWQAVEVLENHKKWIEGREHWFMKDSWWKRLRLCVSKIVSVVCLRTFTFSEFHILTLTSGKSFDITKALS